MHLGAKLANIDVSHVISMYTKRDGIIPTLRSIIEQDGDLKREIILIDDNSKDDTIEVAKQVTKNFPIVTILSHTDNKGPSVRLNEGAEIARGKYLHFFDHDDIFPQNGAQTMFSILESSHADFIYGKWEITEQKAEELLGKKISFPPLYTISENPLETILNGRFKRMCTLVNREFFLKSGGFDNEVFIQDESLPLRLAKDAKKMAVLDAVVSWVPKREGNLSDDKTQLNHDRFMAYYNFYKNNKNKEVFQRALSAAWKQKRAENDYSIFPLYMLSKALPFTINKEKELDKLHKYFESKKVLRP